jgi:hypothetical protein
MRDMCRNCGFYGKLLQSAAHLHATVVLAPTGNEVPRKPGERGEDNEGKQSLGHTPSVNCRIHGEPHTFRQCLTLAVSGPSGKGNNALQNEKLNRSQRL